MSHFAGIGESALIAKDKISPGNRLIANGPLTLTICRPCNAVSPHKSLPAIHY